MIPFYGLEYTYYDHPDLFSLVLYSGGCNLSCYGCHNRTLAGWNYVDSTKIKKTTVKTGDYNPKLSDDELRMSINNPMIDMIILCGGEFLIYPVDKVIETIKEIKEMNPDVYIRVDTNGSFPEKMEKLLETGLVDGFAMDIKGPYWNEDHHEKISEVMGTPLDYSKALYPKILKSLDLSTKLDMSIYRTVVYPIVKDNSYFDEIKKYVSENLKKPHFFNTYVDL